MLRGKTNVKIMIYPIQTDLASPCWFLFWIALKTSLNYSKPF
jgi:hypothetical protein